MEQIASLDFEGPRVDWKPSLVLQLFRITPSPPQLWAERPYGPAAAPAKKGVVRGSQVCVYTFLMGGTGRVGAFGDVATYLYVGNGRKRKTHVWVFNGE